MLLYFAFFSIDLSRFRYQNNYLRKANTWETSVHIRTETDLTQTFSLLLPCRTSRSLIEPPDAVWRSCRPTFTLATCWSCSPAPGRGGPSGTLWSISQQANFHGANDTGGHFAWPQLFQAVWETSNDSVVPVFFRKDAFNSFVRNYCFSDKSRCSKWYEMF